MTIDNIKFDGFDWDQGNISKITARVSVEVVEAFFRQALLIKLDERHSEFEVRFIAIGHTLEKRCLFVAYTLRMREYRLYIRPISARYMHKNEELIYEAKIKDIKLQKKNKKR